MDGAWATPQMDKVNVADDQASGKKFYFYFFFISQVIGCSLIEKH